MVVSCHKCPAEFATQRDLERHLERKIPCDKGSFKCEDCSSAFTSKRSLNEHVNKGRCKGRSLALINQELMTENMQLKNQASNHEQLLHMTNSATAAASSETNNPHPGRQEVAAVVLSPASFSEDSGVEVEAAAEASSSSRDGPSQPPIDTSPAIIDWPDFYEFGNYKMRKTGETPQRVSVHDFIAAITDQSASSARKTFSRLKITYSAIETGCRDFKFPGSGQRDTPVTNARGAVLIMNLLPGQKAAAFRVACADLIVRYLGGDETLIGEIQRNRVVQETAAEINPLRLFGDAVSSATVFHETSSLKLESSTNVVDFRSPQIYARQVLDRVSNVHPVGRPQDIVSASQLAELSVVKIGSQGDHTNRQVTHVKIFDRSKLLDSKVTSSYTHVETQAKDIWKNNGELYEGLFEGKTTRDTELLLVKDQEDYERQLKFFHELCPIENNSLELQVAQEKSKQVAAETEARKAEADARKVEAEANARKADAEARKAEADATVRKAEAEARKVEAEFEMLKFKIAHGLKIDLETYNK